MRTVKATIEIRVTATKVISAFTQPEILKGWWGVERSLIELKPGGVYTLAWNISDAGFGYITTSRIKDYRPENHLILENMVYLNPDRSLLGPMTLAIQVEPTKEFSVLSVCQDGYQTGTDWDWYYEAVKHAWPQALQALKTYVEKDPDSAGF